MVHSSHIRCTVYCPDIGVWADLLDRLAERDVQGAVDEGRQGCLEENDQQRERLSIVSHKYYEVYITD